MRSQREGTLASGLVAAFIASRARLLPLSICLCPLLVHGEVLKPREGGVLRVGVARGISGFNPFVSTRSTDHNVRTLVFEPIVAFSEKLEVVPHLAESWSISKDGRAYTFRLRKGVKFHNGKELTAGDVKWSFEYSVSPKNSAYGRDFLGAVGSADVLDPSTIRFNLKNPQASFLTGLTTIARFLVVAQESLREGERPQAFPPGTGPYQFAEWRSGDQLRLRKFTHYWQKGIPHADELLIKPIDDAEVLFASLRAGDIHIAEQMPMRHALAVRKGEHRELGAAASSPGGLRAYMFNVQIPPFDHVKVRQAIAYAIDKREILEGAHWGWGTIVNQKMEPDSKWYFPIPERRRDVAKAKQLLREAGHPDGLAVRIHGRRGNEEEVQIIQRQLLEAGIRLEMDLHDPVGYMKKIRSGEVGFATFGGGIDDDPDLNYYKDFYTENVPRGAVADRLNSSHYSNRAVDRLLDGAKISMDPKRRYDLYREALEIIHEEVPILYGFLVPYVFIYRTEVKDFKAPYQGRYFGAGNHGFPTAWLEK
jgi:peptide/nickel transport system substrate-binding protein